MKSTQRRKLLAYNVLSLWRTGVKHSFATFTRLALAIFALTASLFGQGSQLGTPGGFGPFRIGPSGKNIGGLRFVPPSGFIYTLDGDHCEIKDERILCLFVLEQHQGPSKEWQAKDAWIENVAKDQFGEQHYKTGAFFLSKRGVRQDVMTLSPGDLIFFAQEFEAGDKSITTVDIVSPHGQIRHLPVK
jgi:hypothetical protein